MISMSTTPSSAAPDGSFARYIVCHALAIVPLSLIGGVLLFTAQVSSRAGPQDHRHVDTWVVWTVFLAFTWLVSSILEYNRRRGVRAQF
ncbi:hypothetical protein [Enhygromyxa salina]|uniref:Uncharacterized protein n=1 Tax=Enhygromyxa salina TaxID=215803 RepID=A0A2S9YR63_9BACT|nr:hypothetical protein [Enhygromyxa salina]PRQ07568.1 hypothetical protein ENSA7_25580 [Enhygromyxa salina]